MLTGLKGYEGGTFRPFQLNVRMTQMHEVIVLNNTFLSIRVSEKIEFRKNNFQEF